MKQELWISTYSKDGYRYEIPLGEGQGCQVLCRKVGQGLAQVLEPGRADLPI